MLGCHGGIGGVERQSTCYLLGDSVLIDAGTGLGTLPLDQMLRIDHVVLTHAHLDHIGMGASRGNYHPLRPYF
jgi:3',5'-cyclic-nucleotide phosphodiesterase